MKHNDELFYVYLMVSGMTYEDPTVQHWLNEVEYAVERLIEKLIRHEMMDAIDEKIEKMQEKL